MKIGSVDTQDQVLVVAEAGNNHEGDMGVARRLVEAAAGCGAQAIKFQTFQATEFVRPSDTARMRQLQRYELRPDQFAELADLAHAQGLLFLSTPLDLPSVEVLAPIVDAYKVASGDIDHVPLLTAVARNRMPTILSTGASRLDTVTEAVDVVHATWRDSPDAPDLAILHCVSSYPAPLEQANLLSIPFLAAKFPSLTIGYSDHTLGIDAAMAAIALGARIVEKHFTLDHDHSDFRDHKLSADPAQLQRLVEAAERIPQMLGTAEKRIQDCEVDMVKAIRRAVVAATDLPAGHVLRPEDLGFKRPAGALSPGRQEEVLGRRLRHALRAGEDIGPDAVEGTEGR